MLKVKIGKKSFKIPTKFKDLYITEYKKIKGIDKDLDIVEKIVKYISILLNMPEELVRDIRIKDLKKIQNELLFFKEEKREFKLQRVIEIQGERFGFYKDLDNMIFSEWIDLNELTKDEETINNNLHLIMALLYRPIKKYKRRLITRRIYGYTLIDYNIEDIKKNAELFNEFMNLDIILGAYFFLFSLKLEYINSLVDYSKKKTEEVKEKKN